MELKKITGYIISFAILFFISKCNAQTTLQQLQFIPYKNYIGKPVDSLIAHLPVGITAMKVGGTAHAFRGDGLYVSYTHDVYLVLIVKKFHYMNPHRNKTTTNYDIDWDPNLFRKETLYQVKLYNGPQEIFL